MSIIKVDYGTVSGGGEPIVVTKTGTTGQNNTFTLDGVSNISFIAAQNSNIVGFAYWDDATSQYVIKNSSVNYGISNVSGNEVTLYVDTNPVTIVYYGK